MSEKTRKIAALALYASAFLCCALAVIMLLIPFNVALEKTVYAVPSGGSRVEITADSTVSTKNFFGYIDYLQYCGWNPDVEIVFLVFLAIALTVSIAFVAFDIVLFVRSFSFSKKTVNIAFLALSVFSLLPFVFAIILQADASVWKNCGNEYIYLPGYSGWNFYEETLVRGSVVMVPVIIFMFLAFLAQCGAGVLKLFSKNVKQSHACECTEGAEIGDENVQNCEVNKIQDGDPAEALIRFKKLLDGGVLTQEEFDAKKKELLGL